jgi:hypothetical protein
VTPPASAWSPIACVEQALSNLVENALRHGAGTVTLHAAPAGRASSCGWATRTAFRPPSSRPSSAQPRVREPHDGRRRLGLAIVDTTPARTAAARGRNARQRAEVTIVAGARGSRRSARRTQEGR